MNPFRGPIYFIFCLGAILMIVGTGLLMGANDLKIYGNIFSAMGIFLVLLPPTIAGLLSFQQFIIVRKKAKSGE